MSIKRLVNSTGFQAFVTAVILFNAILIGVETSASVMVRYGILLHCLNWTIQAIFVLEIVLRLSACSPRFFRFFRDGWNVFDFTVVALSLLPVAGAFAGVARLARVLRVARLVSVSPQMRLIINTMLRSIPSLAHVTVLLAVLLYVYGVLGYYLYHANDPEHWGGLGRALLTTFQMLTLEGWVEMQAAVIAHHPSAWLFFGSFIVVAVFVVVNLFIAVVLNNLEEVKAEQLSAVPEDTTAIADAGDMLARIERMRAELLLLETALRHRSRRDS